MGGAWKDVVSRAKRRTKDGLARRFRELDAARGVLVILMAAYHAAYTANFTGLSPFDPSLGPFRFTAVAIAAGFLIVSGISLRIQAMRLDASGALHRFRPVLRRSAALFVPAIAVTVATFVVVKAESFVAFGILHCMAFSGIIAYPFLRRPKTALAVGLVVAGLGFAFLEHKYFPASWSRPLFWLGFRPDDYFPIDYVPLVPWTGIALIGVFLGSLLFDPKGQRRYAAPEGEGGPVSRALSFLGRHSLFIYVVHIPVIMGICLAIKAILDATG